MNRIFAALLATLALVLSLTVAWFTFLVAAFAETNRLPFDLPEAESELVAGYHTEYSGMKFSMFFIAEYANMLTVSGLTAALFFGGWDVPFTQWDNVAPYTVAKTLATLAMMVGKIGFFIFLFMWIPFFIRHANDIGESVPRWPSPWRAARPAPAWPTALPGPRYFAP